MGGSLATVGGVDMGMDGSEGARMRIDMGPGRIGLALPRGLVAAPRLVRCSGAWSRGEAPRS
jgi:hypothetical protein